MARFTGRSAIVTGAARGIGEVYAQALAAEGASVVVADLNADGGRAVAEKIVADGGPAEYHPVDVADPQRPLAVEDVGVQVRYGHHRLRQTRVHNAFCATRHAVRLPCSVADPRQLGRRSHTARASRALLRSAQTARPDEPARSTASPARFANLVNARFATGSTM